LGARPSACGEETSWPCRGDVAAHYARLRHRPPFLRLYLRHLRALGLPVTDEQIEGSMRWAATSTFDAARSYPRSERALA
jgi:hypothetical protein